MTAVQSSLAFVLCGAVVAAATGALAQVPMPLPRPQATPAAVRTAVPPDARRAPAPLSADGPDAPCTELIASGAAVFDLNASVSGLSGNALCGDETPVRLSAVRLRDGALVHLQPPAVARCGMALAFVHWVRDDLAPAATPFDGSLRRIDIAASYTCRPRNNVKGARLSEHGLANAIDISAIVVSSGGRIGISDPVRPAILFSEMRHTACARFTTVLGPGADAAHEHHLHLDLARRRGGFRICQWNQADDPNP
jgi:hypothetical protein